MPKAITMQKDDTFVEIFNDSKNIKIWEAKGYKVKAGQNISSSPVESKLEPVKLDSRIVRYKNK